MKKKRKVEFNPPRVLARRLATDLRLLSSISAAGPAAPLSEGVTDIGGSPDVTFRGSDESMI